VTTIAEARERLGDQLRRLRREAGVTASQLAALLDWVPSRVHEVEGGRYTPGLEEISDWLRVLGASHLLSRFRDDLEKLNASYLDTARDIFAVGLSGIQSRFATLEEAATYIRNFEPHFVPGLLQTPDYARGRLTAATGMHQSTEAIDSALTIRLRRQQILNDTGRRFSFIVTESSLLSGAYIESQQARQQQVQRLLNESSRQNVSIAVISRETYWPLNVDHGFWIFDSQSCYAETIFAELLLTQQSEVETAIRIFGGLHDLALQGHDARRILHSLL
jgi:transcriptional regulator with XRE-family HTH domain